MLKLFRLITIVFFSIYLLLSPLPVKAHTLKTDGTIGALMHTDPDDDVPAGKQTLIFLEFKDTSNKFNPSQCDCTAYILKDNNQLYSQPLYQNNPTPTLDNAAFSYTFPEKGIYQLKVTGKPLTANTFQPFTLSYEIEVNQTNHQDILPKLLGITLTVLVVIIGLFFKKKQNKN